MTDRRPAPADRAAQRRRRKQQVRRRQIIAAVVIVLLAGALVYFAAGTLLAGTAKNRTPARQAAHAQSPQARTMQQRDAAKPSYRTRLTFRAALGGNISPKSVASSGTGLVFAQNMMYRHSVTVYDSRRMKLVKTI